MAREITWNDAEEIGIQLQEKFPDLDPFTVRFTDVYANRNGQWQMVAWQSTRLRG